MSLIRPQARAALWRWREALAGLGLILFGTTRLSGYGLIWWFGVVLIALGLIAIGIGLPRARFRRAETGSGVVELTEHQLTYMGPVLGGSVSVDHIYGVALDRSAWILSDLERKDLVIPLGATGAEQLFDVFETLPDFPIAKMLRLLEQPRTGRITIWRRNTQPIDSIAHSDQVR